MRLDYLVLIGQFAPFHNGHLALVRRALDRAQTVIVLMGSAGRARNSRHPWTEHERDRMLRSALPEAGNRIIVRPLRDHLYNENAWISAVQTAVREAIGEPSDTSTRIGLMSGQAPASVDTVRAFPQWTHEECPWVDMPTAHQLREHLLSETEDGMTLVRGHVPPPVFSQFDAFRATSEYRALAEEHAFVQTYRQGWAGAPYPPTFVTVDAVVVHSGHLLLVARGAQPGKGLWALPGGFVRGNERLMDAVLRELREETRLKLPAPVLRGSVRSQDVFDHPERSLRGRTITHAFYFEFPAGDLPAVKGGDDAAKARWFPLADLRALESQIYEDHFYIVERFVGRL
ncbi:bifunctional nicotinamide-nucleotide adenylyltransferase/Nudix hydroxylase [Dokdonella sp.]|uniref:bifunctional nicotinamide-nucleotide adenylyltransferase/Nudix hydroxylase n=1 Tax=Dokdonella sp. TaxID=2291710 RepID=UPI0025C08724|nr:bifunctional nicotinamide-nucleotide adenylyltransferase/Nudix hydroxylase [Dokdonella sp.]MBX3691195.1 bifunctional nicotinamide-nucleotide adenylyltransferase/Nudix hydroxylase [Dokdonella sp.]